MSRRGIIWSTQVYQGAVVALSIVILNSGMKSLANSQSWAYLMTTKAGASKNNSHATSAGFYASPWGQHPRLQILTVKELLAGKQIDMPQTRGINITFKQAPKAKIAVNGPGQLSLMGDELIGDSPRQMGV